MIGPWWWSCDELLQVDRDDPFSSQQFYFDMKKCFMSHVHRNRLTEKTRLKVPLPPGFRPDAAGPRSSPSLLTPDWLPPPDGASLH